MSKTEDELFGLISSRTGEYINSQNKCETKLNNEEKSKLNLYNQVKALSQITQSAIEIYNSSLKK